MKFPIYDYQLAIFLQECAKYQQQTKRKEAVLLIFEAVVKASGNETDMYVEAGKGRILWKLKDSKKWINISVDPAGHAKYEISGNNLTTDGRKSGWGRISYGSDSIYVGMTVLPTMTTIIPFAKYVTPGLTQEQCHLIERFFHTHYEEPGTDVDSVLYVQYERSVISELRRHKLLPEDSIAFVWDTPQSAHFGYLQGYYNV